jgi:hypothetical protein
MMHKVQSKNPWYWVICGFIFTKKVLQGAGKTSSQNSKTTKNVSKLLTRIFNSPLFTSRDQLRRFRFVELPTVTAAELACPLYITRGYQLRQERTEEHHLSAAGCGSIWLLTGQVPYEMMLNRQNLILIIIRMDYRQLAVRCKQKSQK